MKKIILGILAMTLYTIPVCAAQEVELTQSQWDDILAMYDDIFGQQSNSSGYLWLLISYFSKFASTNNAFSGTVSFYDYSTNVLHNIESIKTSIGTTVGSDVSTMNSNLLDLWTQLYFLTTSIPADVNQANVDGIFNLYSNSTNIQQKLAQQLFQLRLLELYASSTDSNLNDLVNAFRYRLPGETWIPDLINIPDAANSYSNLLSRYLQTYTNKLATSYSVISNALYKASPWRGNAAMYNMHLFDPYWGNPLSSFGSELPSSNLIYTDPNAAYMKFVQALQNVTGYDSFNNLIGSSTAGGLVGYWNHDIPGVQYNESMLEDAKSFFTAGNWADKNFDELRDVFERKFGVKIEDAADRLEDVFKRNAIIRDASLAGNIKPMADNIQKISDFVASNTNKDILVEMNQNISNVVVAINALEGFVFPESVISNLDELVNREDEYETSWRSFYSPNSVYEIQRQVDNIEQEFRHAETKVSEISNKLERTVATLSPETSGLSRFLNKVKNFTKRNVVSHIPERVQILDTEAINTFLRYHSDTIQFPENAYFLDTDYEIYNGLRISDIIEGIRDMCRIFYAGMGLYFGYKLTMLFLFFMSRTVQYLGIYLNIKALLIR